MSRNTGAPRASLSRIPAGAATSYGIAGIVTVLIVAAGVAIAVTNARLVPSSAASAPPISMVSVGDPAPPFHVTTIKGRDFDSSKTNGPMVLEVFATWCPHCQREVALLDRLWQNDGRHVSFVAVSGSPYAMDRSSPSSLEDVERFAQLLGVKYPIAYDAGLDVAKEYLQGGYPTIVFVSKAGKIAAIETGEVPLATLQADVTKVTKDHA